MNTSVLTDIENQFAELPLDDQLQLLERLVHRLRGNALTTQAAWESDLAAMAADPEIQSELRKIDEEFHCARLTRRE
jgi:hypothetical protein